MREIKFRAWDKEEKQILDVSELNIGGEEITGWTEQEECIEGLGFYHIVLMQSTGLKDKNGVEIYEGDIVEVVLPGNTEARNITLARGKVFYDEASFRVPAGDHISSWVRLDSLASNVEIRIIGNTFENPELLEEG